MYTICIRLKIIICSNSDFDDFKGSVRTTCFVEHVVEFETGKSFLECSCIDGLRGSTELF